MLFSCPSTKMETLAIPDVESLESTVMVAVPESMAPDTGDVMAKVGMSISRVTDRERRVEFPALSVALNARVFDPGFRVTVPLKFESIRVRG